MTAKELLLYLLEYTYEKEGSYPPLPVALGGLTPVQASWKPAQERHSIWQIVGTWPTGWKPCSKRSKISHRYTRICSDQTGGPHPVTSGNGKQMLGAFMRLIDVSRTDCCR